MDGKTVGLLLGGVGAVAGLAWISKRSESLVEGGENNPRRYLMKMSQIGKDMDQEVESIFDEHRGVLDTYGPDLAVQFEGGKVTGCEALDNLISRVHRAGADSSPRSEDVISIAYDLSHQSNRAIEPVVRKYEKEFVAHAQKELDLFNKGQIDSCAALSGLMRRLMDLYDAEQPCPFCHRLNRLCVCA